MYKRLLAGLLAAAMMSSSLSAFAQEPTAPVEVSPDKAVTQTATPEQAPEEPKAPAKTETPAEPEAPAEPETPENLPAATDESAAEGELTQTEADGDVAIDAINFPDATFREYVQDRFDDDDNYILSTSEIEDANHLYLSDYGIESFEGIQYFVNLRTLDASGNDLTDLDLRGLSKLVQLDANGNEDLESLNLTGCTALTELTAYNTALTSLDVSSCTKLEWLEADDNEDLESLNVTGCTALTRLSVDNTALTILDLTACSNLEELYCYDASLTELDVSKCIALTTLYAHNTALTSLDVSSLVNLSMLYAKGCTFTSLNASGCSALTTMNVDDSRLTSLDLTSCSKLEELHCNNTSLTELDVSDSPNLTIVEARNGQLATLNLAGCTKLESLNVSSNYLSDIDVAGCTNLEYLYAQSNQLTSLNVSGCTKLESLDVDHNSLPALNISSCINLKYLEVNSNQLTSLDVSKCTKLETVYAQYNSLAKLNASGLYNLTDLWVADNKLTSLTLTGCSSLKELWISGNLLTSLNLADCTVLQELYVSDNNLTILNVASCPALRALNCQINRIPTSKLPTKPSGASTWTTTPQLTSSQYFVRFDSNGGDNTHTLIVNKGKTAYKPSDPTKEGYKFAGWYTSSALTTAYNFSSPVTKDLYLYAKWTLGAPTLSTPSNGSTAITVKWGTISKATGYQLYRKEGSGSYTRVASLDAATTSYTDSNVTSGVTYTYKIRMVVGTQTGEFSSEVKIVRLAPTTVSAVTNSSTYLQVKWGGVAGATTYTVYRKEGSGSWKTLKSGVKTTSYNDTTAVSGSTYTYRVRAYNGSVYSTYSNEVAQTRLTPTKLSTPSNSSTGLKVSWSKVAGATTYNLYRKEGSGSWQTLKTGLTGITYTDTAVTAGTKYTYRVRVYIDKLASSYSNEIAQVRLAPAQISAVSNYSTYLQVKWGSVAGATSYTVYRKEGTGSWKTMKTGVTSTNYKDTTAVSGTKYTYRVRAYNSSTYSTYSNEVAQLRIAPTSLTTLTNNSTGIKVIWSKVTGATGYLVQMKSGNSAWTTLPERTGTSYTAKNLTAGESYSFRVYAKSGDVKSSVCSTKTLMWLQTPTNVKAAKTSTGIKVSWTKSVGATGYNVFRRLKGSSKWEQIKSTASSNYTDKSSVKGKTYEYCVCATNDTSASPNSTAIDIKR